MNDQTDDPRIDEIEDDDAAADRDDNREQDDDQEHENGRERRAQEGGNGARRRRRRRRQEEDYEPQDERALQALEFVSSVIKEMEVDCRARLRRPKEDADAEINVEIYGKDSGRVIGKKGQVLAALQFLVHRVINRPGLERRHILVDAEGYRSRRDSSLASMARRLGKQAVAEGKIITFEPMNPRDRRVVHLALAKFEGVITKSDGEGDDRRVQIIPVRRG